MKRGLRFQGVIAVAERLFLPQVSSMAHPLFDFTNLTHSQRVELAIALWDSLPVDSTEPPLTDEQRAELLRRADNYRRDPEAGSPWSEVRARIQQTEPRTR